MRKSPWNLFLVALGIFLLSAIVVPPGLVRSGASPSIQRSPQSLKSEPPTWFSLPFQQGNEPISQTIVVDSFADSGPGSLRQALLTARSGDTIAFNPQVFPPQAPSTILVLTPLPDLKTGGVTVDGSNAGVILDGSRLPREQTVEGLRIISAHNIIRGLQILNFSGRGIMLIDGAQNNTIGGAQPGQGNLISANRGGVNIVGSRARDNIIIGNYIGTDATGTRALGNRVDGVWIGEGAQYNQVGGASAGERNLISGNESNGVILDGSMYNLVIGNYIGTDSSGTRSLGNRNTGVGHAWGAQYNTVGGGSPGERNIISGNGKEGIWIGDSGTMYNRVSGNYIGIDVSGTLALPNGASGVNLGNSTKHNIVGGDEPENGNVISANQADGVGLSGEGVENNIVLGNFIGTDSTGTLSLGNLGNGISITAGASLNTIGPGNCIAYNAKSGVVVSGSQTQNNTITASTIYANGDKGIVIDGGANGGLAPAVIEKIDTRSLRGLALPGAVVEIFSDQGGQGGIFEGSLTVATDGSFDFVLPAGRFTGPNITTTVTDTGAGTSIFSLPVSPPAPRLTRELPQIVAVTQVNLEPQVIGTNLGLAIFCVLFFGFTSTVFNQILQDYRRELADSASMLLPSSNFRVLEQLREKLRGLSRHSWGRLILVWLLILFATAFIESFLDCGLQVICPERLATILTLFIAALVVSGLELASDLYAHHRWARTVRLDYKIQWVGMLIAIACVIFSRLLEFRPGYLYGIIGAIYLMPRLSRTASLGKRSLLVLLTVLVGALLLWVAASFLPASLIVLEPILLTAFLISLQGVFFQLIPLSITGGGDIWGWKKGIWFMFFLVVFFFIVHFVLNPNNPDIQALQQNGVQTLLALLVIFGLTTLILWLLFPFRYRRKLSLR